MLRKINEGDALKFKTLSEEEKKQKGILGRLYGPVASFIAPTRNERKYTEGLWEKLFESPLIKERFKAGGVFGELNHPEYEEVNMEKVAVIMPQLPVKDENGLLEAYVDILDTPCGRVAYQLAKYGYKFGISSRGSGELIEGDDGTEIDPDSYELYAFDLVEIPAVESARLTFTESLNKDDKLVKSLKKSIDKADEHDKKIMLEALDTFGIKFGGQPEEATTEEEIAKEHEEHRKELVDVACPDLKPVEPSEEEIDAKLEKKKAEDEGVVDDKPDELVAEFQKALVKIKDLEEKNRKLGEQLSVCNAKGAELQDKLNESSNQFAKHEEEYKEAIKSLSESAKYAKSLKEQNRKLTEKLTESEKTLSGNQVEIKRLTHKLESLNRFLETKDSKIDELNEQVENVTKKLEDQSKQLDESKGLVEKYKTSYRALKESYLQVKAQNYGLSKEDLKSHLGESYKVRDIDNVCEALVEQKQKLNKLPFKVNSSTKLDIKESKNEYIMSRGIADSDDGHC